jgi:hypothetical protein
MSILPFYRKYLMLKNYRKYKPRYIINIDETSLRTVPIMKQLHVTLCEDPVYTVPAPLTLSSSSCVFSIASDGTSYPTVILISKKNIPEEFIQTENLRFLCTENGWMHQSTLEIMFEDILIPAIVKRRIISGDSSDPALIVLDGHSSRHSAKLYCLCMENNIDLLTIPAHTSHIVQPLDNGVNGSFKQSISLNKIYNSLDTEKDKRSCFLSVLHDAIDVCLANKVVKHSWEVVGLSPFNPYTVLASLPTASPPFINKHYEKYNNNTKSSISGKILVLSSVNYSFENLHLEYLREIIKNIEFNISSNINHKEFLEEYMSSSSISSSNNNEIIFNKIDNFNKEINNKKLLLIKIQKNFNNDYVHQLNKNNDEIIIEKEPNNEESEEIVMMENINVEKNRTYDILKLLGKNGNNVDDSKVLGILEKLLREFNKKNTELRIIQSFNDDLENFAKNSSIEHFLNENENENLIFSSNFNDVFQFSNNNLLLDDNMDVGFAFATQEDLEEENQTLTGKMKRKSKKSNLNNSENYSTVTTRPSSSNRNKKKKLEDDIYVYE